MRFILAPLFPLLFYLLTPTAANPAEIRQSQIAECAIRIEGELVEGDSQRFHDIANTLDLLEEDSDRRNSLQDAVCLNSDGGSWAEARNIAESVSRYGITTRILPDDRCLSACAFIFMSGRTKGFERDGYSRYLHVRGSLGFHGPYLNLTDDRNYTSEEMRAASVFQNKIISDFIRFASDHSYTSYGPAIPMSLIGDMLAHGPNELVFADTVERIARWGITLEGAKTRISLDPKTIEQACENSFNWPFDRPSSNVEDDIPSLYFKIESALSQHGRNSRYAVVLFPGDADRICKIRLSDDADGNDLGSVNGIYVCTDNGNNGINMGGCPDYEMYFPVYYALPPPTPIISLIK